MSAKNLEKMKECMIFMGSIGGNGSYANFPGFS